jgi:uncharacterized membrane protein
MSRSRVIETSNVYEQIKVKKHLHPAMVIDWLHAGVEDTHLGGWASLFYGFAFTITGILIHAFFAENYWLLAGLTTGFFLIGPFLATGLYDISRRIALGQTPSLLPSLTAWLPNLVNIALFAAFLLIALVTWTQLSFIIFAYYFNHQLPTFIDIVFNVLTFKQPIFTLVYFSVGGLFAALTFAISVVAIPLMLDSNTSAGTAAWASLRVCLRNPGVMSLWALCIVVLIGVGFATSFLGLIVTMPVVGHASWHVYRNVIEIQR